MLIQATDEQIQRLVDATERAVQKRADDMPAERDALEVMMTAYQRLTELGWRDACYCPKDGSTFAVIEAGSTGIHPCIYEGEWPNGKWQIVADGDMWPSRPILWRPWRDSDEEVCK